VDVGVVGGWITEAQSETELGQDARSDSMKWMLDLSTRGYRYVLEVGSESERGRATQAIHTKCPVQHAEKKVIDSILANWDHAQKPLRKANKKKTPRDN
jgi:hypothetical protein